MRTITATAVIAPDHTLTMQVPPDVSPGVRKVVVVLEDTDAPTAVPANRQLPSPHRVGLSDPSMTFRREEMYGDDGR